MKRLWIVSVIGIILIGGLGIVIVEGSQYPLADNPTIYGPGSRIDSRWGTLILNTTLPASPSTVQLYRGHYDLGGNISISTPNWTKPKTTLPEDSKIPLLAQQVLEPFGGIPPDAVVYGKVVTSSYKLVNRTTGEVVAIRNTSRNIVYDRQLKGMPVLGQTIRLDFGENGELLFIQRLWMNLTPIGNVQVISAEEALVKLKQGDTLDKWYPYPKETTINDIYLAYCAAYPDRYEEIVEPVWVFSGPTGPKDGRTYLVDARISGSSFRFANFTASPTSGIAPLTVSFNDTSAGPIFYEHWDFGDGTNETGQNMTHMYTATGDYTVKLYVLNEELDDTITKTGFIHVYPKVNSSAIFTDTLNNNTFTTLSRMVLSIGKAS